MSPLAGGVTNPRLRHRHHGRATYSQQARQPRQLHSLTQLGHITGLGQDKFNDPLCSYTITVHEISSIDFNYHHGTHTHDALNIRKNYTTAAPVSAWRKGLSSTYADSPAVYAIKETQGSQLGIRVRLRGNGLSGVYVRAIAGGPRGGVGEKWLFFGRCHFMFSSYTK